MIVIMVTSEKGGVGKSSLSHAIALGASLAEEQPFPVLLGHTDNREPVTILEPSRRGYEVIDLRDPAQGTRVLREVLARPGEGLLVVDTGANMSDYTSILMSLVDLILVPVMHDYDSLRLAKQAGEAYPEKTGYILNQCPARHAREFDRYNRQVIQHLDPDKIIHRFGPLRAVSELISPEPLDAYARNRLRAPSVGLWQSVKAVFE